MTQVRYLNELLPVFEAEGIVKLQDGVPATTYPGMPWEPKEAFHALARYYAGQSSPQDASRAAR